MIRDMPDRIRAARIELPAPPAVGALASHPATETGAPVKSVVTDAGVLGLRA